ncbi:MAG: lipopolysaccharide heptosyltransferase I [Gammaproteobacteria bacterium]|nr:lipopolysaccharide heptosyltransferase I [Gammaproteobacteria bacterium]
MKCLIIKTSSLGDIVHTLPALTDAQQQIPGIQFDWVVEEAFQEIPLWHPTVNQVIPVAIRRWRKNLFSARTRKEWRQFKDTVSKENYDLIIDAQGLLKSAWLLRYAQGIRHGYDKHSIREPFAARFYTIKHTISRSIHAVERIRQLFALSLNYQLAENSFNSVDSSVGNFVNHSVNYGIKDFLKQNTNGNKQQKQIFFFHGTTWQTKHWPEVYWLKLAQKLTEKNFQVLLPWGNDQEKQRAQWIKSHWDHVDDSVIVLPKLTLSEIALQLLSVKAVVSVDTGLAHLAAALDIPSICLFGPTNPELTRPYGKNQCFINSEIACQGCLKKYCELSHHDNGVLIQPACYSSLNPDKVLSLLKTSI